MRTLSMGLAVAVGVLLGGTSPAGAEQEKTTVIGEGSRVSIEYTVKLDDGSTADTNVGGDPLVYRQGAGEILPALERSLDGLKADDRKEVTLSPEQGYGAIDPDATQTVPLQVVPEAARQAGAQLVAQAADGNRRFVTVREVRSNEVVLDLNHPLAGKTLHFEVKVLAVE